MDYHIHCPICDARLEGSHFGGKCPTGHYNFYGKGSYASEAAVYLNGRKDYYHIEEWCNDHRKLLEAIPDLRSEYKSGQHQLKFKFDE